MIDWLLGRQKIRQLLPSEQAKLLPVVVQVDGYAMQHWRNEGSLLDALVAGGVPVTSSCHKGHCGACLAYLRSGEVAYCQSVKFPLEAGELLLCSCVPLTPIRLALPEQPVAPRKRRS